MLNQPLVSIIMPMRNAASFLSDCLDTVLAQTLQDVEVICVDDGSTDKSREIAEDYARRDRRLLLICQDHQGAGIARNHALIAARGRYIGFMDADDMYPSPETLEQLVSAAEANHASVCGGELIVIRGQSWTPRILNTGPCELPRFTNERVQYRDYQGDYGFQLFIYERALIVRAALYFPHYARFQDPPFFVAIMHAAGEFMGLSTATYCHRRGHRMIEWSDSQTADLLRGITDNLHFSQRHALERLHTISTWRLREEYATIIQTAYARGAAIVRQALDDAECAVVPDLLTSTIAPRSVG